MADQANDNGAKGRSWDQLTNGSTSAATMGAGATGEVGASGERKDPAQRAGNGAQQRDSAGAAGRTDDLLAGGSSAEQSDKGFRDRSTPGQGSQSAAANRQSAGNGNGSATGQDVSDTDDDQYDQGTART